jgi:hypothetical protein
MKKFLVFGVLIFLIVLPTLPVWSSGKAETDKGQREYVYVIRNQDGQHVQVLGGKSNHACNGLARAEERARFMEIYDPSKKPKPRNDADSAVRKKKK